MLKEKLKKNLDLILFLVFIGFVYAGGWQADVFGFVQRGILAIGLFDAEPSQDQPLKPTNLDFHLQDVQGKRVNMAELRGKIVFINIWASWCPPCVAEMPGIHDLYEELKELNKKKEIVFLMISVDEEKEKAIKFMERKEFRFPLYFPINAFPPEFSYQSIPSTFVISPEGKIVYQKEGMASYDSQEFKDFLLSL